MTEPTNHDYPVIFRYALAIGLGFVLTVLCVIGFEIWRAVQ